MDLFCAQRIPLHRTARRDTASGERGGQQHRGDEPKGDRIGRSDAKQQTPHRVRERKRPAGPNAKSANTNIIPCRSTMNTISAGRAPMAMRTPISCVR
jgi:hypothetical protein